MDRRRPVYIWLDSDLIEVIDKMRKTEQGEISRSSFINKILRKYLEVEMHE